MELNRTTATETAPPATALDLSDLVSDEEWEALMSVSRQVDPGDPEYGLPWKRSPVLLSY